MIQKLLKCAALVLVMSLLLSLAACGGGGDDTPTVNGEDLLQVCLEQVRFASPLESMGADSSFYFTDLPDGVSVELYSGSGVHADRLILFTLADEGGQKAARTAAETHLAELREQCVNYHPEEVVKVDNALFWQQGVYLLVCVTGDTEYAAYVLDNAAQFTAQLPDAPESTDTEPEPTDTEPEPTDTEPEPTDTEPKPTDTEPEPTDTEPEPTDTEPEPTDTEPKPTDTEPKPTDTEPKPTNTSGTASGRYPVLTSQSGKYHTYSSGSVIRVDGRAFENYGYSDSGTTRYTDVINRAVASIGDSADVYVIAIPTAIGILMPDDIQPLLSNYADQGWCIQQIFSKIDDSAIKVDVFSNMMEHRDEYLYFYGDYHWNGRGAYYAYESWCEAKGVTPYTLDQRRLQCFDGFKGALYLNHCNQDPNISPDTVEAFHPYSQNISMTFTDTQGNSYKWKVISDVTNWNAGSKYSTFAAGDNPYTEFFNADVTDGSVAVVVKESYGNALIPYLVDHYSALYEIDYRYWDGDLAEFVKSVGADDVIFANNLTMMGSAYLVGMLSDNVN